MGDVVALRSGGESLASSKVPVEIAIYDLAYAMARLGQSIEVYKERLLAEDDPEAIARLRTAWSHLIDGFDTLKRHGLSSKAP